MCVGQACKRGQHYLEEEMDSQVQQGQRERDGGAVPFPFPPLSPGPLPIPSFPPSSPLSPPLPHPLSTSELQQQAGGFVLRRTQDLLARHLPPLRTFTLFVRPSELQVRTFQGIGFRV